MSLHEYKPPGIRRFATAASSVAVGAPSTMIEKTPRREMMNEDFMMGFSRRVEVGDGGVSCLAALC